MNLDSELDPQPKRQESMADRAFTYLGLMIFCWGGLLTFQSGRVLASEWLIRATEISDSRMIDVLRSHFLTGVICLTAGAFFVGKRWLVGGVLLLMAIWIFLGSGGDR